MLDEIFAVVRCAGDRRGRARLHHARRARGTTRLRLGGWLRRCCWMLAQDRCLRLQIASAAVSSLPLLGRRVLVTRAAHQAGKLSEGLRALGAEPVEVPVLEIRPPASFEPLDKALRNSTATIG